MSIWDVELDKLQDSRLLALRMHVARYVVRVADARRRVVVVVPPEELTYRDKLVELLEAAGAAQATIIATGEDVPEADIVFVSRLLRDAALPRPLGPSQSQVWEVDLKAIADVKDGRVVGSVEALIRMVLPEALGANGTPPDEAVAVRLS